MSTISNSRTVAMKAKTNVTLYVDGKEVKYAPGEQFNVASIETARYLEQQGAAEFNTGGDTATEAGADATESKGTTHEQEDTSSESGRPDQVGSGSRPQVRSRSR